jgi:hypothetical protein
MTNKENFIKAKIPKMGYFDFYRPLEVPTESPTGRSVPLRPTPTEASRFRTHLQFLLIPEKKQNFARRNAINPTIFLLPKIFSKLVPMKLPKIPLLATAILLFAGCGFMNPLYTEKDVVAPQNIPGNWVEPQKGFAQWHISPTGKKKFIATMGHKSYYVVFVQLKNHLFVDLKMCASHGIDCTDWTKDHSFGKVRLSGDSMVISILNADELDKMIKKKQVTISHEYTKGHYMSDGLAEPPSLIITESTAGLQKLMLELYDKNVFLEDMVLIKQQG